MPVFIADRLAILSLVIAAIGLCRFDLGGRFGVVPLQTSLHDTDDFGVLCGEVILLADVLAEVVEFEGGVSTAPDRFPVPHASSLEQFLRTGLPIEELMLLLRPSGSGWSE